MPAHTWAHLFYMKWHVLCFKVHREHWCWWFQRCRMCLRVNIIACDRPLWNGRKKKNERSLRWLNVWVSNNEIVKTSALSFSWHMAISTHATKSASDMCERVCTSLYVWDLCHQTQNWIIYSVLFWSRRKKKKSFGPKISKNMFIRLPRFKKKNILKAPSNINGLSVV